MADSIRPPERDTAMSSGDGDAPTAPVPGPRDGAGADAPTDGVVRDTAGDPLAAIPTIELLAWSVAAFLAAFAVLRGLALTEPDTPGDELALMIAFHLAPLVFIGVRLRRRRARWRDAVGPWPRPTPWLTWGAYAVALHVASRSIYGLLWPVLPDALKGDPGAAPPPVPEQLLEEGPWAAGVRAATLVVAAPVMEEIVFRGVLLRRWIASWGWTPAIVVSSVLFGALHEWALGATAFAVVMCALTLRSGSLWPAIFVHALGNGVDEVFEWQGGPVELVGRALGASDVVSQPWLLRTVDVVAVSWLVLHTAWLLRRARSPKAPTSASS